MYWRAAGRPTTPSRRSSRAHATVAQALARVREARHPVPARLRRVRRLPPAPKPLMGVIGLRRLPGTAATNAVQLPGRRLDEDVELVPRSRA